MEQLRAAQRRQASRARHQQHSSDQRRWRLARNGHHGAGRVGHCSAAQEISAVRETRQRGERPTRAATTQQPENNREQEMSMRTIRTRTIACAVAMAAVLSLAPLRAQTTQTALSKEAGTLSDKFAGLARVMEGKYDWKPGEGVRSVGDVFNLIVTENGLLVETLTGAGEGRGGGRGAQVIEPAKLQEALKISYANVQKAIEG